MILFQILAESLCAVLSRCYHYTGPIVRSMGGVVNYCGQQQFNELPL